MVPRRPRPHPRNRDFRQETVVKPTNPTPKTAIMENGSPASARSRRNLQESGRRFRCEDGKPLGERAKVFPASQSAALHPRPRSLEALNAITRFMAAASSRPGAAVGRGSSPASDRDTSPLPSRRRQSPGRACRSNTCSRHEVRVRRGTPRARIRTVSRSMQRSLPRVYNDLIMCRSGLDTVPNYS